MDFLKQHKKVFLISTVSLAGIVAVKKLIYNRYFKANDVTDEILDDTEDISETLKKLDEHTLESILAEEIKKDETKTEETKTEETKSD